MQTRLILKRGEKGTKKLTEQYGDQLLCVRYRYDAERKVRMKTVELVVEEVKWDAAAGAKALSVDAGPTAAAKKPKVGTKPTEDSGLSAEKLVNGAPGKEGRPAPAPSASANAPGRRIPAEALVRVKIAFGEQSLRDVVKKAAGRWKPEAKAWELRYDKALELGLEGRLVPGPMP